MSELVVYHILVYVLALFLIVASVYHMRSNRRMAGTVRKAMEAWKHTEAALVEKIRDLRDTRDMMGLLATRNEELQELLATTRAEVSAALAEEREAHEQTRAALQLEQERHAQTQQALESLYFDLDSKTAPPTTPNNGNRNGSGKGRK